MRYKINLYRFLYYDLGVKTSKSRLHGLFHALRSALIGLRSRYVHNICHC